MWGCYPIYSRNFGDCTKTNAPAHRTLLRDFEHHTDACGSPAGCRAIQVPAGIQCHAAYGGRSVASIGEVVQVVVDPASIRWRQPEDVAVRIEARSSGRPVKGAVGAHCESVP